MKVLLFYAMLEVENVGPNTAAFKEEVKIYNDVSKLDKRRTNLSKDNYKVINKG